MDSDEVAEIEEIVRQSEANRQGNIYRQLIEGESCQDSITTIDENLLEDEKMPTEDEVKATSEEMISDTTIQLEDIPEEDEAEAKENGERTSCRRKARLYSGSWAGRCV